MDLTSISICFAIGFFFESIFGIGGSLISYSLLGFFIDLKLAIICAIYIGSISSFLIIASSWRNFNYKIFLQILPVALIGTILGGAIFLYVSSQTLGLFFGVLLMTLSIKSFFFENFKISKISKQFLLVIAAISQGAFGVGGPFIAQATKSDFANKSQLRTTLAAYFLLGNLVRFFQFNLAGEIDLNFFINIWPIILPVIAALWLGHHVHLRISEKNFRKGLAILTMIASIRFLLS